MVLLVLLFSVVTRLWGGRYHFPFYPEVSHCLTLSSRALPTRVARQEVSCLRSCSRLRQQMMRERQQVRLPVTAPIRDDQPASSTSPQWQLFHKCHGQTNAHEMMIPKFVVLLTPSFRPNVCCSLVLGVCGTKCQRAHLEVAK
jgi:hypothetical protein